MQDGNFVLILLIYQPLICHLDFFRNLHYATFEYLAIDLLAILEMEAD